MFMENFTFLYIIMHACEAILYVPVNKCHVKYLDPVNIPGKVAEVWPNETSPTNTSFTMNCTVGHSIVIDTGNLTNMQSIEGKLLCDNDKSWINRPLNCTRKLIRFYFPKRSEPLNLMVWLGLSYQLFFFVIDSS